MNLDLTDDQAALRDTLREFFGKEAPPSVVRAAEPLGFDAGLWAKVVGLGLVSVAVPEDRGGGGAGFVELAVAAELLGRSLAPVPLVEAAVVTALLASLPAPGDLEPVVDAVVAGDLLPTLALRPTVAAPPLDPAAAAGGAGQTAEGSRSGPADAGGAVARLVPAGAVADVVVVLRGDELAVVRPAERPAAAVPNLGAVPVDHPQAAPLATMALLFAAETAFRTASDSLHFHGGYGYALEYDIQLYFRRAKAWALAAGDPRRAYAALAHDLFDADPTGGPPPHPGRPPSGASSSPPPSAEGA